MSMSSSSSSKRRRLNRGSQRRPRQKQHLYLALDDWNCGYSIHKLDADDIIDDNLEHRLPEPAAVRLTSTSLLTPLPHGPTMAFAAMGSKIFIDTNSHDRGARAKPSLVYDTETAALVAGPRLPAWLHDLGTAVAVGDHLYALTTPRHNGFEPEHEAEAEAEEPSLQVLSWALTAVPTFKAYDAEMEWSWEPRESWTAPPPSYEGKDVVCYAVHPDESTIFMSDGATTHSLDTSTGVWKDLGEWALPFTGQAFFDADLDAWVGLRRSRYRAASVAVCCCPVVSRSAVATRPPRCTMLKEDGDDRLIRRGEDDPMYRPWVRGTTLTYMGDSRFALVENVLRGKNATDGAVLHVTLFGLMYDQTGELRTKAHRATRSYAVSKHTTLFSHAAFWM